MVTECFDSRELYQAATKLLAGSRLGTAVHTMSVSCFDLVEKQNTQLSLLDDRIKAEKFIRAVDEINERWGNFVMSPARMLGIGDYVKDRIGFGNTGI